MFSLTLFFELWAHRLSNSSVASCIRDWWKVFFWLGEEEEGSVRKKKRNLLEFWITHDLSCMGIRPLVLHYYRIALLSPSLPASRPFLCWALARAVS